MGAGDRPRAIIAHSDDAVRRRVRESVEACGLTVIAVVAEARAALELGLFYAPDVLVIEARLAIASPTPVIRALAARRPSVRTLVLEGDPVAGVDALRAGACGVADPARPPSHLRRALSEVLAGRPTVPRALVASLVAEVRRQPGEATGLRPVRSPLTAREWEVLDLLCAGETTTGVAERLVVSPETVRTHVKAILRKLGVGSRAEAVRVAERLRSVAA